MPHNSEFCETKVGCLIINHVDSCVVGDGGNTRYKDGSGIEMCCLPELTRDEWLEKYALFDEKTNNYYYKEQ